MAPSTKRLVAEEKEEEEEGRGGEEPGPESTKTGIDRDEEEGGEEEGKDVAEGKSSEGGGGKPPLAKADLTKKDSMEETLTCGICQVRALTSCRDFNPSTLTVEPLSVPLSLSLSLSSPSPSLLSLSLANSLTFCPHRQNFRRRNYAEVTTQLHGAITVVEEFEKYQSIPQIKQLVDR